MTDLTKTYAWRVHAAIKSDPALKDAVYTFCLEQVKALLPAASASIDASLKGQARTDAIAEALIVAIKLKASPAAKEPS